MVPPVIVTGQPRLQQLPGQSLSSEMPVSQRPNLASHRPPARGSLRTTPTEGWGVHRKLIDCSTRSIGAIGCLTWNVVLFDQIFIQNAAQKTGAARRCRHGRGDIP